MIACSQHSAHKLQPRANLFSRYHFPQVKECLQSCCFPTSLHSIRNTAAMGLRCRQVAVLSTGVAMSICGICVFSCGFLLKRQGMQDRSDCGDKFAFYKSSEDHLSSAPSSCWYPPRFEKAVILMIDALKHEFAVYGPPWEDTVEHFRNKMPVFSELIAASSNNSLLLKFVADAPTTTMQRLKGLMTGSLPTFVDAGANFFQSKVSEDSLIDQMFRNKRRAVFMGDDTWIQLFPGKFTRTYPFPSFVVKDLHTVDEGVLRHLYPELASSGQWDIIVAHFLGVDHCGHWLGKNHPQMAAKLHQMDAVIRNVSSLLPPKTLLVVMSDHGMTADGDHGGDTTDEVEALLFLHANEPFLTSQVRQFPDEVAQVDLVPTLSLLLGLPVPYSNLGGLLPHLFPAPHRSPRELLPLWLNVQQVSRYLGRVPNSPFDPEEKLSRLRDLWDACLKGDVGAGERFSVASYAFLEEAQQTARKAWATFQLPLMYGGLALSLTGAVLVVCLGFYLGSSPTPWGGVLSPWGICCLCWLGMPYSNSFAVAESAVTLHLLQALAIGSMALGWTGMAESRRKRALMFVAALLLGARALGFFCRCREEHAGRPCEESPLQRPPSEEGVYGTQRVLLACLLAAAVAYRAFPCSGCLWGSVTRVCLVGSTLSLMSHWLVQLKPTAVVERVLGSHQELLPNMTLALSLVLLVPALCRPRLKPGGGTLASTVLMLHLLLLAGESYTPALCLQGVLLLGYTHFWHCLAVKDIWSPVLNWLLIGQLGFFGTGHQAIFSTLHWKAAFVGARANSPPMALGALRVLLNTFAGPLLSAATLPALADLNAPFVNIAACYCALLLLQICSTMGACLLLRRHLMVWEVFAPRLVFQVSSALLCFLGLFCGWMVDGRTRVARHPSHLD